MSNETIRSAEHLVVTKSSRTSGLCRFTWSHIYTGTKQLFEPRRTSNGSFLADDNTNILTGPRVIIIRCKGHVHKIEGLPELRVSWESFQIILQGYGWIWGLFPIIQANYEANKFYSMAFIFPWHNIDLNHLTSFNASHLRKWDVRKKE